MGAQTSPRVGVVATRTGRDRIATRQLGFHWYAAPWSGRTLVGQPRVGPVGISEQTIVWSRFGIVGVVELTALGILDDEICVRGQICIQIPEEQRPRIDNSKIIGQVTQDLLEVLKDLNQYQVHHIQQ